MKLLIVLMLALAAPYALGQSARLYVIHFSTGPAWVADKPFDQQLHAQDHSRNLARLRADGVLLLGARYEDKGMIVVRAESESVARTFVDRDPAVQAKVFAYEIAAFAPFYEGCVTVLASDQNKCE